MKCRFPSGPVVRAVLEAVVTVRPTPRPAEIVEEFPMKNQSALAGMANTQTELLGAALEPIMAQVVEALECMSLPSRLAACDASLWSEDDAVRKTIANRLGWLGAPAAMRAHISELTRFVTEIRKAKFETVVLLGMGGSSLCPEVCAKTFGSAPGFPQLAVLDSTAPGAVRALEACIDLKRTLFLPASKSGGTIETATMLDYFWHRLEEAGVANPGDHFAAITDPGSPFSKTAERLRFRACFLNPPDIGGRFSALSLFGLVPMAVIGMDVKALLRAVPDAPKVLGSKTATVEGNDALRLGAALGTLHQSGYDKLVFLMSPGIASLGDWIEQLVAESTGKDGAGILPVVANIAARGMTVPAGCAVAALSLEEDPVDPNLLARLEKRGVPVVRVTLRDKYDLGAEFQRWEIATAVAGVVLGINPFDEPNVTESKNNTSEILKQFEAKGRLAFPKPDWSDGDISLSFSKAGARPWVATWRVRRADWPHCWQTPRRPTTPRSWRSSPLTRRPRRLPRRFERPSARQPMSPPPSDSARVTCTPPANSTRAAPTRAYSLSLLATTAPDRRSPTVLRLRHTDHGPSPRRFPVA